MPKLLLLALLFSLITLAANAGDLTTPEDHVRSGDQTFLTFPEWYLVHSPTEYASYLENNKPSGFPYFAHIGQFWQSYKAVYDRVKEDYPFNGEYHTVVSVIGISTTAEYGVKGAYELTFGRLSEATRTHGMTDEDRIAHQEAQSYADFILERPWYEFDFMGSLSNLWTDTSFFAPDMIRKLERKYFLTSEYLIKAFYAWVIGQGTGASFEAPIHQTSVITDKNELLMLPRYRPFTYASNGHALKGENFVEIAGNRGTIVLSVWSSADWEPLSIKAKTLFIQPIITIPGQYRFVVELAVSDLAEALRTIKAKKIKLEHIYDF
ncbi:hypothetical protein [Emcibacter sp.]|uniref:hypothetical protein n=1 Tax=Emcibacter sp. TaxID=1979954 RepID=UPI002AA6EE6E|nr:hypothetical protein [Emcibacter sp.]